MKNRTEPKEFAQRLTDFSVSRDSPRCKDIFKMHLYVSNYQIITAPHSSFFMSLFSHVSVPKLIVFNFLLQSSLIIKEKCQNFLSEKEHYKILFTYSNKP